MIVITVPHAATLSKVPRNEVGQPLKPIAHYTDWLADLQQECCIVKYLAQF